ncbi:SGNH/GDSL hydrolase family protein [Pseudomonas aeruginosa]|nr:SGNH/GDSL hydrolase family protein [Pseudomonas aeruginosa]
MRDAVSVPADFTCGKCTHLQLLQDRVRELELELDELRIIREAEGVIDRSYRDIVTPENKGSWVTVRGGKRGKKSVQGSPVVVPLNNNYTVLDTVGGDGLSGAGCSDRVSGTGSGSEAQKGRGESGRALVIGDSIVRSTDRRFCGRRRDTRMVCCLPGARVHDVSDRVFRILKGEGEQPEVVVHIGTNDVGKKGGVDVRSEFRELGWKLKARTDRVVISGLLPAPRDSEARNRERAQLNTWLQEWCRREGFQFLDNWTAFWGRWDLYKQDGLHLNQRGTNILGGRFASTVREGLN